MRTAQDVVAAPSRDKTVAHEVGAEAPSPGARRVQRARQLEKSEDIEVVRAKPRPGLFKLVSKKVRCVPQKNEEESAPQRGLAARLVARARPPERSICEDHLRTAVHGHRCRRRIKCSARRARVFAHVLREPITPAPPPRLADCPRIATMLQRSRRQRSRRGREFQPWCAHRWRAAHDGAAAATWYYERLCADADA